MKSYPSYKDSGVEWIGEIPSKWGLSKLKYHTQITSSSIDKKYHEGFNKYPIIHYNDIVKNKKIGINEIVDFGYCSEQQFDSFKVMKGDLIVTKDSMDIKNVCDSSIIIDDLERCVFGYHLTKFSVGSSYITPHYLFYYFNNSMIKKFYLINSNGTTIIGVGKSTFENTPINLPPLPEQTQIVSFLDTKTQKIDKLIEKTEKKIELLKEKRISLINHYVTKGLNPNVEMKDSGIKWIGEIPINWEIVPLKFLGHFQNGIGKGLEFFGSGFPFMNYGDVYNNEITPTIVDGKVQSNAVERERYSVKRGDVFFTRTSESKDDIGVTSVCLKTISESVFSGFVIRFRFSLNKHIPEYSRYHFQTHWKKVFIESKMNIVTRSSLSQRVLGQLPVLIISTEEQTQIVEYLDEQTQKINSTIKKETQRVELLKEYRQSLISEVVTGKVDVRDWKR